MRKLLFVLFISLVGVNVNAQWIFVNPTPQVNDIYDLAVPMPGNVIGVTNWISDVLVSTSGGASWTIVSLNISRNLRALSFLTPSTGYGVGGGPDTKPWKTTNGGLNWIELTSAPDTTKYDVSFSNTNTGWAVGFNSFIIKTTNGGTTWFSQTAQYVITKTLRGAATPAPNIIFAVGNDNTILRSVNGGDNFTLLSSPLTPQSDDFFDIEFATPETGFICGQRQRILKTTNAGFTWDSVYGNNSGSISLNCIDFNGTTGLACGSSGTVLRTTNLGLSWSPVSVPFSNTLYAVRFESSTVAYLGGDDGWMFKSTDAGATWSSLTNSVTTDLLDGASFADNNTGYFVGNNGAVIKTTNAGASFVTQTTPGGTLELNNVSAPLPNTAYIAGDDGRIFKTVNGGTNWTELTTGSTQDLLGIDFINDNTGYSVGQSGAVLKTTNGGTNWNNVPVPGGELLWDVDFVDENHGWTVGVGEVIYGTTNGGTSWSLQFNGTQLGCYAVSFVNTMTGYASGSSGFTYKTTNGGTVWTPTPQLGNTIWAMEFFDADHGVAIGSSGYPYRTTNGGASWIDDPRRTINTMYAVAYTPDGTCFLGGSLGIVLKGGSNLVNITNETGSIPQGYTLSQNYPNPFNPVTKIRYELPNNGNVELTVFDMSGKEITKLVSNFQNAGVYSVEFDGTGLSSGVYFYRLKASGFTDTKKMILIK